MSFIVFPLQGLSRSSGQYLGKLVPWASPKITKSTARTTPHVLVLDDFDKFVVAQSNPDS